MEFMFEDNSRKAEIERRKALLRERKALREANKTSSSTLSGSMSAGLASKLPGVPSSNTLVNTSTIVEPPVRRTRKSVPVSPSDVEFTNPRKRVRKKAPAKVRYNERGKKLSDFTMTPSKLGWLVCAGLFLRLIFMDNGVLDYYRMENHIQKKQHGLETLKQENASLISEIYKIKTESSYQKKLAREHLGVIAADEYLILFAQDSSAPAI